MYILNENSIKSASKEELENIQDELFSKACLTDHEIYLYELIDKRLTSFKKISGE